MPKTALLRLFLGLVLAAAFALPAGADTLTEGEFKDLKKEARKLMKKPGTVKGKARLIGKLGEDDSVRSSELLLGTWQRLILMEFDGPRKRRISVQLLPAGA